MIPDKSLSFAKAKKSDSLINFPAFLFLGFLYSWNLLNGFDIMAVNMKMSISKQMHENCRNITDGPLIAH